MEALGATRNFAISLWNNTNYHFREFFIIDATTDMLDWHVINREKKQWVCYIYRHITFRQPAYNIDFKISCLTREPWISLCRNLIWNFARLEIMSSNTSIQNFSCHHQLQVSEKNMPSFEFLSVARCEAAISQATTERVQQLKRTRACYSSEGRVMITFSKWLLLPEDGNNVKRYNSLILKQCNSFKLYSKGSTQSWTTGE